MIKKILISLTCIVPITTVFAQDKMNCVSNYGKTNTGLCRSIGTSVQAAFDKVGDKIDQIIVQNNYKTSGLGLVQPTNVIYNWANLSKEQQAEQMSAYGFALQNNSLKPFMVQACENLANKGYKCQTEPLTAPPKKVAAALLTGINGIQYVRDFSRGSVILDYDAVPYFLDAMKETTVGNFNIKVVLNHLFYPMETRYRDVQILLEDKNTGFLAEVIILGPEMYIGKDGNSHPLFEARRSNIAELNALNKLPDSEKTFDIKDKIKYLTNQNSSLDDKLHAIHDKVFRKDAITSCSLQDRVICKDEIDKII